MRGSRASRPAGLVLLAGLALLLVSSQPAEGHSRRAGPVPPAAPEATASAAAPAPAGATALPGPLLAAAPPASLAPWLAIVAGLAVAGAVARRAPRAATLGLALVLTVFAAESTLHSVHHIGDPRGAAHCQVLSVAQHVHGDAPAAEATADGPADLGPLPVALSDSLLADPALRPGQGRAPPARSV
jgi:hypothetical protein